MAHLREGLSLIPKMSASPRRFEAEIALQSNLAMAYTANAGWSDPNVYGPYSRALKLCANHGTIREKATVLWGSTIAKLVNCELTKGLEHAQDFGAAGRRVARRRGCPHGLHRCRNRQFLSRSFGAGE